jgi:hypothetical protein
MALPRAALVLVALLTSLRLSAAASAGPTVVPVEVVGDSILVQATVNGAVRAMLIVDPNASTTLITPLLLRRLGQPIPLGGPRRRVSIAGGQMRDVPLATIVLQVGEARQGLEVGVHDAFPETPEIDGLLGADFLQRFRVMLDRAARRMTLIPLSR